MQAAIAGLMADAGSGSGYNFLLRCCLGLPGLHNPMVVKLPSCKAHAVVCSQYTTVAGDPADHDAYIPCFTSLVVSCEVGKAGLGIKLYSGIALTSVVGCSSLTNAYEGVPG